MDSSAWLVLVIGSAALLAIAMMLARRVPGEVPAFARMPPDLAILWLVIALAPATQIVRLSTFVYDSKRTGWSPCCFIPANPPIWIVAPTLLNQLLIVGLNVWVVGRELLRPRVSVVMTSAQRAPAV